MFKHRSTVITIVMLCVSLLHSQLYAQNCNSSCSDDACFIETRVNCNTDCSTNTIKCPNDGNNIFNKSFFSIRPQDSNAARRIQVGRTRADLFYEGYYLKTNLTLEWQQSFNKSKLAKWFSFNCSDCMSIGIPGDGQTFDINGLPLGLATEGLIPGPIGTFCLAPTYKNFIADFDFQLNLDDVLCGLWARLDLPIVMARTNIGLDITSDLSATATFPAGSFTTNCSTTTANNSIICALQGDMCGKFSNHSLTKWGVAGIHLDLGYDFVRNDCGNLGVSLHLVAPTGNRPKSCFLLEPIVGANRCFQLGANVNGQYNFTICCSDFSFMIDATITHLFRSTQRRLFGLNNNGPGSQYLSLKRFNAIGTAVLGTDNVANVLCGKTKIGSDFMFDGAAMLQYSRCNWFGNIGYNLWVRSKEKRSNTVFLNNFGESNLGIKGNQPLSTVQTSPCPGVECISTCIPNITTASGSTIGASAAADATTTFLCLSDIDFCLPLNPFALTNKVFGSIGYGWECCCRYYELLIGGEVEFSRRNSALNQWGVFIKGGFAL